MEAGMEGGPSDEGAPFAARITDGRRDGTTLGGCFAAAETPWASAASKGHTLEETPMGDTKDKAKDAIDKAAGKTKTVTGKVIDKTKDLTGKVVDKTKDLTGKAVDKTKDAARATGDAVKRTGEKIKDAGSR